MIGDREYITIKVKVKINRFGRFRHVVQEWRTSRITKAQTCGQCQDLIEAGRLVWIYGSKRKYKCIRCMIYAVRVQPKTLKLSSFTSKVRSAPEHGEATKTST